MLGWYALLQPRLRVYSARPRRRNGGASNRVRFFCCRECGARICYLHHLLGDEIVRQDKTQRCSAIGFNPVSMTHSFKRRNGARFALHITPIARVSPDQLSTPRVDHEFFPGVSWALCVCSDCGTWLGWIFGQHQTAYPVPVPTKKEHEDVALIRRPSTRGLRPSSALPTSRVVATRPSSGRPTSRVAATRPSSGRPTSPVASALLPTPVIKVGSPAVWWEDTWLCFGNEAITCNVNRAVEWSTIDPKDHLPRCSRIPVAANGPSDGILQCGDVQCKVRRCTKWAEMVSPSHTWLEMDEMIGWPVESHGGRRHVEVHGIIHLLDPHGVAIALPRDAMRMPCPFTFCPLEYFVIRVDASRAGIVPEARLSHRQTTMQPDPQQQQEIETTRDNHNTLGGGAHASASIALSGIQFALDLDTGQDTLLRFRFPLECGVNNLPTATAVSVCYMGKDIVGSSHTLKVRLAPTLTRNALDNDNATLTCKQPAACDVQAPSPPLTTTARAVTPGTTRSRVKKKSMVAVIMEEKRLQMLHASATRGGVNGRPNTASRGTQRRCGRRAEKGAPHGAKEEDARDISSKKGEQCIIVECGKKGRPAIPRNENDKPAADVGRKSDAETEQPTEIMSEEKDEDAAVSKNEKGDVPRVVAREKDVASEEREESVILPLVANAHDENEKLLLIVPPETKDRFATAAILCEKEDQPAAAVAAVPQACDYAEEINPLVPVLETSMSRFLQKEMMETDNANNFNFCDLLVDEQSLDMEQLHAAKKPTCDYTALSQLASGRCARPPSGGHPRRRMSKDAPSVLSVGGLSNPSRICTTPTLDVAPSRDTKEDAPQADMTRVDTPPRVAPSAAKYEIMPGSPVKTRRNNEETSDKLRRHSWKEERVANKCDSERVAASIAEHRLDEHVVLDSARTVSTTASQNGDMSSSARSTAPSTRRKRLGTNNVPPMKERDASQEENLRLPQCTSSNKATTVSKPTRKSAKPAPDTLQPSRCSDDKDGTRPSAALKPSKGEDNLLNPSGDVGRLSTARKPLPNGLSAETRPQCGRGVRGDVQCGYAGRKGAFIASKQGSGVSPRTARAMKDETPARSEEWPDDAPSHRGNSINSCSKPTPLRTSLDGARKRPPSTYLPKTFARSTTGSRI